MMRLDAPEPYRTLARGLALALALMTAPASALAGGAMAGDIHVSNAWARALPKVSTNGAAYMVLSNKGGAEDRLLSVASPVAARVELHTHSMEGDVLKMRRVRAVPIPAGGEARFEPGGMHVMLMGLEHPMDEGYQFPMTLTFERSGSVEVQVTVTQGEEGGMKHGHQMRKEGG